MKVYHLTLMVLGGAAHPLRAKNPPTSMAT